MPCSRSNKRLRQAFICAPPNAPAPRTISPYTTALVDNLERLKLDYEIVLGLHGRQSNKAELMKASRPPKTAPTSKAVQVFTAPALEIPRTVTGSLPVLAVPDVLASMRSYSRFSIPAGAADVQ